LPGAGGRVPDGARPFVPFVVPFVRVFVMARC